MSLNLTKIFEDTVGDTFAKEAGTFLGENIENTSAAIRSLVQSLQTVIVEKSKQKDGLESILNYLKDESSELGFGKEINGLFGGGPSTNNLMESGERSMELLFNTEESQLDSMIDLVSSANGVSSNSAGSLLKMATPVLMSILKDRTKDLDTSGLANLLLDQQDTLEVNPPPAKLDEGSIATEFVSGQESSPDQLESAPQKETVSVIEADEPVDDKEPPAPAKPGFFKRVGPWIILIGIATLMFLGMRSCGGMSDEEKETLTDGKLGSVENTNDLSNQITDAALVISQLKEFNINHEETVVIKHTLRQHTHLHQKTFA
ncbi:MAG: DUF937 domain-containing protein [Saprospiraceae bacterium]|nr:DUF937 domain-containing protein [Saprospiraceae bacterium]